MQSDRWQNRVYGNYCYIAYVKRSVSPVVLSSRTSPTNEIFHPSYLSCLVQLKLPDWYEQHVRVWYETESIDRFISATSSTVTLLECVRRNLHRLTLAFLHYSLGYKEKNAKHKLWEMAMGLKLNRNIMWLRRRCHFKEKTSQRLTLYFHTDCSTEHQNCFPSGIYATDLIQMTAGKGS